jgi:flagellar motor protein MotB
MTRPLLTWTTALAVAAATSVIATADDARAPLVSLGDDADPGGPLAVLPFAPRTSRPDPAARPAIGRAARWLAAHPDRLLIIEGHADHGLASREDLFLSQQRTDAARAVLIEHGADPVRLVGVAYADANPPGVVLRGSEGTYAELVRAQRSDDGALEQARR